MKEPLKIKITYTTPSKEVRPVRPKTLSEFCAEHGLSMEITERPLEMHKDHVRFWCTFEDICDVVSGRKCDFVFGHGNTPEECLLDFIKNVSGRTLIFNHLLKDERKVRAPVLKGIGDAEIPPAFPPPITRKAKTAVAKRKYDTTRQ